MFKYIDFNGFLNCFGKMPNFTQLGFFRQAINLVQYLISSIINIGPTYTNCSSIYCSACANQFICSTCSYTGQPVCCPKYCKKCINMTYCIECQAEFWITQYQQNIICSRITNYTDPNSNWGNCAAGYYFQNITSNCQSCGYDNCGVCSTYQVCTKCLSGYFFYNISTLLPPFCLSCPDLCAQCLNRSACTVCADGFYMKNGTCNLCQIQNCYKCSNQTTCISCYDQAIMLPNSTKCTLCQNYIPNCMDCYYNSTTQQVECLDCMNSFYNTSAINCTSCPAHCINCTVNNANLTCAACSIGYGVNSNDSSCIPCKFPCTECFTDEDGQYSCGSCSAGFYGDFVSGVCYFCSIQNCIACQSQYACTSCSSGYYLQIENINNKQTKTTITMIDCAKCPQNCLVCQMTPMSVNSTILRLLCIQCNNGYILKSNNCVSCHVANCLICDSTNITNCLQCISGFAFDDLNNQCSQCQQQNCQVCSYDDFYTQQTCDKCFSGFGINTTSDECFACPSNCIACHNTTNCAQCAENYYIVNNSTMGSRCALCAQQCLGCNIYGCLYCQEGYYTQVSSTHPNNVQCLSCGNIPGCLVCFSSQYCKQCTNITYSVMPTIYGNCSSCPQNCITCTSQLTCTLCQDNFLLLKQINSCFDTTGIPVWGIFVCTVFGCSFLFVLVQSFRRYLRRRRLASMEQLEERLNNNNQIQIQRNQGSLEMGSLHR